MMWWPMIEGHHDQRYVTNKPFLAITGGTMTSQDGVPVPLRCGQRRVLSTPRRKAALPTRAGLKMGDVIIKVDDTGHTSMEDLTAVKKAVLRRRHRNLTNYREARR
jgi:C-terminal processing protease CtpA/Prc